MQLVAIYREHNPDKLAKVKSSCRAACIFLAPAALTECRWTRCSPTTRGERRSYFVNSRPSTSSRYLRPTHQVLLPPASRSCSVGDCWTLKVGGCRRDYRAEVRSFYERFNPAKLGSIDKLLGSYRGREELLLAKLQEKYGVSGSPSPPPASKMELLRVVGVLTGGRASGHKLGA